MDIRSLARGAALGLLAISLVACGGGASSQAADEDMDAQAPAATTAADAPAADPNEPADVGAIIYDEEVPVPGTTLTACQILTAADITAAFGLATPVAEGAYEADPTVLSPGHSECRYEGDYGRIIVDLTPEDGANLYDAVYDAYEGREVIPGIGDGAFWAAKTNRGFVWQDRVTVMLTIHPHEMDLAGPALMETLGQSIIGKL